MCDVCIYLWRSQQCSSDLSWFFKVVPPNTADIIVRVCRDESSNKDDMDPTELLLNIQ